MSSTNKTSLGLNMWEASDKPVRQDFVNDNTIIDEKITQLNSNLSAKANASDLANYLLKSSIAFEGVAKVRFGVGPGTMNLDLYGGATTFYRLLLDYNSKTISFSVFDGTNLTVLFTK